MREYEDPAFAQHFADIIGGDSAREGPPHVSDLIYCLRRARVRRDHYDELPPTTPEEAGRWSSGLGWQELLENLAVEMQVEQVLLRPRSKCEVCQGPEPLSCQIHIGWIGDLPIKMEPDGEALEDVDGIPTWVIWEFKSTRYSSLVRSKRKGVPDRPKMLSDMGAYLDQVRSYCALRGVNRARFMILHLLGDYRKGSITPSLPRCIVVEFDDDELEEWLEELRIRATIFNQEELPDGDPAWRELCQGCVEGELSGCPLWLPEEEDKKK